MGKAARQSSPISETIAIGKKWLVQAKEICVGKLLKHVQRYALEKNRNYGDPYHCEEQSVPWKSCEGIPASGTWQCQQWRQRQRQAHW